MRKNRGSRSRFNDGQESSERGIGDVGYINYVHKIRTTYQRTAKMLPIE
jgi:hypothetical protein